MQYLVDTNIISEIMRKTPNPGVSDWFSVQDSIFFSIITVEEITFGLSKKNLNQKMAWFQQFTKDKVTVLETTDSITRWSGNKRGELSSSGITVTMADSLIAATAHHYGLILATRNTGDFQHFGIALLNPFFLA